MNNNEDRAVRKVIIDPGHGGTDSGATGNNLLEKDYNLLISKYMYDRFKELVELDEGGFIAAKEDCLTSCPGVFAAGDCRTKEVRQLTTAAADGAVAGLAACKYLAGE